MVQQQNYLQQIQKPLNSSSFFMTVWYDLFRCLESEQTNQFQPRGPCSLAFLWGQQGPFPDMETRKTHQMPGKKRGMNSHHNW